MPTKKIGIYNTGQLLFSTPKHVVGKVTALNIDNKDVLSGNPNTIIINDQFSGDVSNGVATPTVNSGVLVQYTVYSGEHKTLKGDELGDIRTYGKVYGYGSVSGDIALVVGYKFE